MFNCVTGKAQNLDNESDRQIEQVIESLVETDSESDNPQVLDDLINYSSNRLNINNASREELERLHLIDYRQIQEILDYRKRFGYILSAFELNVIESLTPGAIKAIEPFITFDQPLDTVNVKAKKVYQKLILRGRTSFPLARGYSSVSEGKPAAYLGVPASLYTRYKLEIPEKLELGFIADHDAGEEFFRGSNKQGFDHYSGYLSWKSKSFFQQVTVGDYYLKFGQGLSYWSGSGFGKSSSVLNVLKMGQGIRPYTSTDENLYFRGIATVLGKGSLKMTLFYSNKNRDANIALDKVSGDTVFTSLKTGGYHRTFSEVEDEKAIREQDAGVYAELRVDRFRLGGLFAYQQFNINMITGTSAYKAKSFAGSENMNLGIDYQLALRKFQFFGEAGMSKNLKPAVIQGLTWHTHPQMNLSLYYRNFDPGYHAFYGNPLSEGTEGRNESGLYTGIEYYPFAGIKISGYGDFYHFPFLTYSTLAPSNGQDFLAQVDFFFFKNIYFYMRGKFESKPQKYTGGSEDPSDYDESVKKLRFHCEWKISKNLVLKNRFEYAGYSFYNVNENGFLLYQDINFSLFKKIDVWTRYAWFQTDGYNSRIYTYENDLLYYFAIPEFHGKGHRIYFNLKWQPNRKITTYLKAGQTLHDGALTWGSGNDQTKGNYRIDVRAEVCFKF